jgi:small subunit ribosomal protein S19
MGKRSNWKGPFVSPKLLAKFTKAAQSSRGSAAVISTWSRSSTILPNFVNFTFMVHNGKKMIPVRVTDDMVGKKLGEFAPTRTFGGHSGNKKTAGKK